MELHTFADLHIGDKHCDFKSVQSNIDYVADTPNAYCMLNGDILNNATRTSVSDSYSEQLTPMQQIEKGVALFAPLKDKILAITSGNHEQRTYRKEGIDLMHCVARELGLEDRFCAEGLLLFLRFGLSRREASRGRRMQYSLYVKHGAGGGAKEGAKAIRLADMASTVDADVYIHSHTHLPLIMKQSFFRVYHNNASVEPVDKLFVNTSATMDYGGYAQSHGYKPASKKNPIIFLDGTVRHMTATL